jgi:flagellar hook protein FlgE
MMRSMFSAISGMKNHQTFMDVVANNIANVNTTGYKQQRVTFQDILSQTVKGASGPAAGRAGVNAEQIGLGVQLGAIDTIQTQGTLQSTGKLTDMAIQGDGYYEMSDGTSNFFTRDGSFDLGTDGTLISPSNGLHVMGWQAVPAAAPATGVVVDTTVPAGNITIPIGAGMTGRASTTLSVTGNLNSSNVPVVPIAPGTPVDPAPVVMSSTVYDSLGNATPITMTYTPTLVAATGSLTWAVTATTPVAGVATALVTTPAPLPIVFDGLGKILSGGTGSFSLPLLNGATTPEVVTFDFSGVTQLASASNLNSQTDGASAGTLTGFTVGQNGDITGQYSNGYKQALGQIALASFSNPAGLTKAGGNLYTTSANSGNANVGVPGANGRGQIATGFLEGSNVDLAQQFTNMIMAERGFQANSKVITTSDEILQDLVNLKR